MTIEMSRPTGSVFVFGSGDCCQLGLGEDILSKKKPTEIPFFADKNIVEISAGGLHNLALSLDGSVYSWGCNDEKALGHQQPEWSIGRVDALAHEKIVHIACGDSISAALTESGKVYTWGTFRDSKGIVGFSEGTVVQEHPTLLESLSSRGIVHIAAGANHLVALSNDAQVFTWGSGEQGQLGRRVLERHKLKGLNPTNVTPRSRKSKSDPFTTLVCGSYHTLSLTSNCHVYSWGLNNYGQLGHDDNEERMLPEEIPSELLSESIVALAAGEHHSIALSRAGKIIGWGRADSGQLGEAAASYSTKPVSLSGFPEKLAQIASGGNHCLAVGVSGSIYSWGFGGMYQLGNGKEDDEYHPYKIDFPAKKVLSVKGGGQHSMILCQK